MPAQPGCPLEHDTQQRATLIVGPFFMLFLTDHRQSCRQEKAKPLSYYLELGARRFIMQVNIMPGAFQEGQPE